jgi:peptide deformylase
MAMTRNDIIGLPDKILRKTSSKVSVFDQRLDELISDMISAGLDWEKHRHHEVCVGLAAVQVGRLMRVIVIRDNDDIDAKNFQVLINPRIIKAYGAPEHDFEGCLSIQDVYGVVPRYPKIKYLSADRHGHVSRHSAEGFMARLIQHETDHIKGQLFIDYIKDAKDAFFRLTDEGEMERMDYAIIQKSGLFR